MTIIVFHKLWAGKIHTRSFYINQWRHTKSDKKRVWKKKKIMLTKRGNLFSKRDMFRRDTRPLLTARLYKVWSWWGPALMLYYSLPLLECWNEVTTVKPRAQLPEVGTMIWLIDMHCNDLDLNYLVGVSLIEILLHLGPSN